MARILTDDTGHEYAQVSDDQGIVSDTNPLPVNIADANIVISGLTVGAVDQGAAGVEAWPVTGPLTDTELRATPIQIGGAVTVSGLSGGLTDTELRASPVVVSGIAGLTDTQLRASPLVTISENISTVTQFAGQITCTSSGVAVQGTSDALTNGAFIKALAGNTGKIYVGGSNVTVSGGYELSAGEVIIAQVANLNEIYVVSTVNGDKVCWLEG